MADVCTSCQKPLVVAIDDDGDDDMENGSASAATSTTVPDDVELLACAHHFHWECLLEAYSVTACPSCNTSISANDAVGTQKVLCNLRNEGGYQQAIDILPELAEESYLKAYPEERKARAFLHFCRQGDLEAILGTLQDDEDEDEDEDPLAFDILRYQDQLNEQQSALHCAVISGNPDVAWLLLFLASQLELEHFPPQLVQQAMSIGLARGDNIGKIDIRSLKDTPGRTAERLAAEVGGPWQSWLGTGRLALNDDEVMI